MSAFDFFDDIWCIIDPLRTDRRSIMERRLAHLGIVTRARRFPALPSPADPRIGRALSHRRIIQDAAERGLRSVLVIEDATLFLDRADAVLAGAAAELRGRAWKLLYLGTPRGTHGLTREPGCAQLCQAGERSGPHAVAYHAAAFAELLARMPLSFAAMRDALGTAESIATLLTGSAPALVVHPAVATVPADLPFQEPADQERFVP
jgi:hypothetical protein